MANTNTNTGNTNQLSTDIYEVSDFFDQIRRDNIPNIDETSSIVGIFGYMNEMFSQTLQNTLIVTSETSNEAIPTRAKFTKNVINHAMNLGITNIFATPATMTMMIYLPIDYIEQNFVETDIGKAKFILDKNIPIFIDNFEFHLDYDIIITRIKNSNNTYSYSAMYDLYEPKTTVFKQNNPISNIINPYITTLTQITLSDQKKYLSFSAKLHQVSMGTFEQNVLSDNSIENKTVTFSFGEQLVNFNIDVEQNGVTYHITPVYCGLVDYTSKDEKWCYYEFLDEFTIRVLFDSSSFVPKLNSVIKINVTLCDGSNGNFTYNQSFTTSLKSEKYNDYNGMYAIIYPLQNGVSTGGKDKKSISDLRKIIPREASSRGSVINTSDLQNFFNSINDDNTKIYFKKRKDNPFERMYYSYLLLKKNGYIYPTNTLNLRIDNQIFDRTNGKNNLSIKPGTVFYYYDHGTDTENDYATLEPPIYEDPDDGKTYNYNLTRNKDGNLVRVFEYMSPFLITVDDDLISSYLMTIMNEIKLFRPLYGNNTTDTSEVQFIATNIQCKRNFNILDSNSYDNKYELSVEIIKNNIDNNSVFVYYHKDDNANIIFDDVKIKTILVFYADEEETIPYKYIEGVLDDYNESASMYTFKFTMYSDDVMDLNNRIRISGLYNAKSELLQTNESLSNSHGYMNKNNSARLFILADFGKKRGEKDDSGIEITEDEINVYPENGNIGNRNEIESILPKKEDVIKAFLNRTISIKNGNLIIDVVSIIKSDEVLYNEVMQYYQNEDKSDTNIMRYLRREVNKQESEFVNRLLSLSSIVIDSYHYEDLSRYTVCNTLSVIDGIDFYHDYSSIMRSTVNVKHIQDINENGYPVYIKIKRIDAYGNEYIEFKPKYSYDNLGNHLYQYTINRVPMVMNNFFNSSEDIQDFINDLDIRRKYMMECINVLEDTFSIDFKFFNTYGPSKMFYYSLPSYDYKVKVIVDKLNIYALPSETLNPENESNMIISELEKDKIIHISKVKDGWGYYEFSSPVSIEIDEYTTREFYGGWIKLSNTKSVISYISNVALSFKFALEAITSTNKSIADSIIYDIKNYIEDINNINELHIPNLITLITNNYREQLTYFEFLDVNDYGVSCQHIYLENKVDSDITPEFLNVESSNDGSLMPLIDITVY